MHKKAAARLIILFALIPFLLISSSNAIPEEKKFTPEWKSMTSKTNNSLRGIWGSIQEGVVNVFAVGDKGTIRYYDGNNEMTLHEMGSGTDANLHGVWGSIQKGVINIYAVSEDGMIRRYNYVVGDDGTIRHYAGNKKMIFSELVSKTVVPLHAVWGNADIGVFAVGDKGSVRHYAGNKKMTLLEMVSGTEANLHGIWGSIQEGKIDVFAVGEGGTIRHYDGNKEMTWSEMVSGTEANLHGIWGSIQEGKIDVFAVGEGGTIRHYDGNKKMTWSEMDNNAAVSLHGIWGLSGRNVYAVGDNGTVIHFNGKEWSVQTSTAKTTNLYSVWASPNPHVFVVGADGFTEGKSWAAIWGWVCDLCSGIGIQNVQVQRFNTTTQQWQEWCYPSGKTNSNGWYDCTECALSPNERHKFKFIHQYNNYYEEQRDIDVAAGYWIKSYSYLLPKQGYERCVSGVISRTTTRGGVPFREFLKDIPVKLYKKVCDTWNLVTPSTSTNNEGRYKFTISDTETGIYKVEPDQSGYSFYPEYNNIEITIPQASAQAYDFTRNQ